MSETEVLAEPDHHHAPPEFVHPNILHTLVFLLLATASVIIVSLGLSGFVMSIAHAHDAHHGITSTREMVADLVNNPLLGVASQELAYLVALIIAPMLFRAWWRRSFSEGLSWNWNTLDRKQDLLLALGLAMGFVADVVSDKFQTPKDMPVDQFFKSTIVVWVVAIFGTTLGPMFEEITFRGFMYPALKTACEWAETKLGLNLGKSGHSAMVFSVTLTSIIFAGIHGPQISWSTPVLALLFTVSVVLCAVRIKTGSVAASTIVHAGYNLLDFIIMFIASSGFRHLDKLQ